MILITGATGFLGSRLLEALLNAGNQVVAVKRSFSDVHRLQRVAGRKGLHFVDIDLVEPERVFQNYKIDTIVHTATEYGRSGTPGFKLIEANVLLPLRLAEIGINSGVRCFINTDSYFNKRSSLYSNLINYSLSKAQLLTWLRQMPGQLQVVNVVLEHIYGPEDSDSKFVESMIQNIAVKKVDRVSLTHGHQKRDFIYLDDVVSAFMLLIEYGRHNNFSFSSFEVGTGTSVQIRDFLEEIKIISSSDTTLGFGDIAYRSDEIMESKADIKRLLELGWTPTVSISDGVSKILASKQ